MDDGAGNVNVYAALGLMIWLVLESVPLDPVSVDGVAVNVVPVRPHWLNQLYNCAASAARRPLMSLAGLPWIVAASELTLAVAIRPVTGSALGNVKPYELSSCVMSGNRLDWVSAFCVAMAMGVVDQTGMILILSF
jgi:hypothetical protein